MKFIKGGIIFEPHSEFVIAQMTKAGYTPYEETKEETTEKVEDGTKEKKVGKKPTKKK